MSYWPHNPNAWPSVGTRHLELDPDKPHPYQQNRGRGGYGGCGVCGGSPKNPVHIEPLEGWPK